ncbi:methane/ammonia monooxygenase subunit C [Methylacidimicrobium cyclopophantes]|uniref:Methane/ammonia monooxygenase subunit C n=1 Tax=Methylacidimicrobium cyclopophantes TaxID=1041766 RepID=A0A5E6MRE8_9BACT|nr:methane monooxygenase/ammonia monooxygenase subunit C [Methylacidimicrobium cyclopophantes]VVM08468.1 methane/ammonia monooxygenase subunit C [Methylacidimicrobium cyclopophantes]
MLQTETTTTGVGLPEKSAFSWRKVGVFFGALTVFYLLINVYLRLFAFSKGLDYTSQDYSTYWMGMLLTEFVVEAITAAALWGWLWITRDRALDRLTPAEELTRYWAWAAIVLSYAFSVYVGASFFTEQDGTWHNTVVRDTDFTPSHIVEFYLTFPIYIIFGVASLIYAMTRLPQFATRISLPYVILIGSPIMIMPNIGLNEFGHTRWFMEELFVAPLHWGFAFFGWGGLAIFGVGLQACPRIMALIHHVYYGKPILSASEVLKDPTGTCDPACCYPASEA